MSETAVRDSGTEESFRHEALFYAGDDDFVAQMTHFIRGGIEADEPTFVVVAQRKIDRLREELGQEASAVRFADMEAVGRNPGRIIPAWRDFVEEHGSDGRPLRGIGEPIWAGRSSDELVECQRHESLLNLAFAHGASMWLVCPYDTAALPPDVIEEARRSHPYLSEDGEYWTSPSYHGLDEFTAPFDPALSRPPGVPHEVEFGLAQLSSIRELVAQRAAAHGLDPVRTQDLVVAVGELIANSVRHGGGRGLLRIWTEADTLVCEVADSGSVRDPLVGRRRPDSGSEQGLGLWLVHRLCDLVQMRTSPGATVVRVHMSASAR